MLINLILDAAYVPEPFDYAHLFIDAARKPQREWIDELARGLHVGAPNTPPTSGTPTYREGRPDQAGEQGGAKDPLAKLIGSRAAPMRVVNPLRDFREPAAPSQPSLGIPVLTVLEGNDRGKVFTLHANIIRLSRKTAYSSEMPITLDDPEVDIVHALISKTFDGSRQLRDRGSRTGTFVNGQMIDGTCMLKDGDEIRVGNTVLVFTYPATQQGHS